MNRVVGYGSDCLSLPVGQANTQPVSQIDRLSNCGCKRVSRMWSFVKADCAGGQANTLSDLPLIAGPTGRLRTR